MANIPFTHLNITDGTSQVNKTNMQTLFDALRKVVSKSHRGAGEELDADTVSGHGIGGFATAKNNQDMNALTTPGIYRITGTPTNIPTTFDADGAVCMVFGENTFVTWQFFFAVNSSGTALPGEMYFRCINSIHSGGWQAWGKMWNSVNDGNGGQPPMPKPKSYVSGLTQGEVTHANLANGETWANPGGVWYYKSLWFTTSGGFFDMNSGIATGNIAQTYGAGYVRILFLWRVA